MDSIKQFKREMDKKVLEALKELKGYAETYEGPSSDHKGCKPNRKALEVLVSCFPDGPPDDEEGSQRWFEGLIQCYDYPDETMLAEACQEEIERLQHKIEKG